MDGVFTGRRIPKHEVAKSAYGRSSTERKSLQDQFLLAAIASRLDVDIYLKNESVRRGQIADYDNWSVLLYSEGKQYLLFKSGIMGIIPTGSLVLEGETFPFLPTRVAEADSPGYSYGHGMM
ncbi:MAG: hypothetical protein EOM03_00290 [Clostridia bacterium]|nr:hypothetical protein [Clostridia bacterium]NLF21494.1 hypothetical protein [Clostridiaceae bacterium]